METEWKIVEPWLLGGGSTVLLALLGRYSLKLLSSWKIGEAKDQGELLLHNTYAQLIKALNEERSRQNEKMAEMEKRCDQQLAEVRHQCAEDKKVLVRQIAALRDRVETLEKNGHGNR